MHAHTYEDTFTKKENSRKQDKGQKVQGEERKIKERKQVD